MSEVKTMGATALERQRRVLGILEAPGGGGAVRSQATADDRVEREFAAIIVASLDYLLPHIKQVQERQSIEEHAMQFLEECIQALR